MKDKYIFKSERLGFRNWTLQDLPELAQMNADLEVMKHFPKPIKKAESAYLLTKLQEQYQSKGYTYFAVEILKTEEFIGFIGLTNQSYKTKFTPAIDVGWRLKKEAWQKGYATEGALKCLEFGFDSVKLERIIATCTIGNIKSENVMKKIGMIKKGHFFHPELSKYPNLEECVWYEIKK